MTNSRLPFFGLCLGFALLACNSPILNHSDANEVRRTPITENDPHCPIAFPVHALCASWTWEKLPNDVDPGTATLRFWKKDGGTENGPYLNPSEEVFVRLWMPSMGHGSSPVRTSARLDSTSTRVPGVYDATGIFFVMPGEWEVWIQLKESGAVKEQAKFDQMI